MRELQADSFGCDALLLNIVARVETNGSSHLGESHGHGMAANK